MKTFAILVVAICLAQTISGSTPDCSNLITGAFVQDFDECDKFYQCAHGVAYQFECPDELYFNVDTNRCDYQENVRCGGEGGGLGLTPAELCLNKEPGLLLSDPYDCNAFIQCTNDRIGYDLHKCGPGLVFNPIIKVCDHTTNYKCTPLA